MYCTETDTQITQRSPYSAFQEESIPLIASAVFHWKETKNLFWWQKYRYCCFLDAARFCFSLHWSTSLVSGSCKDLVYFHVVKKIKNTVWYKATGLKLIENPHTVLWQQIVYLFVGCMCVPIQCRTKPTWCVCVCVCVPLHCVRGNSLLGLWRVQRGVMNRMLLCSAPQLSTNQWRRERWGRKGVR